MVTSVSNVVKDAKKIDCSVERRDHMRRHAIAQRDQAAVEARGAHQEAACEGRRDAAAAGGWDWHLAPRQTHAQTAVRGLELERMRDWHQD